jgi:hypothetical protein
VQLARAVAQVSYVSHLNRPSSGGPDGALCFTNFDADSIGRVTATGTVTTYTLTGISATIGIA